jgi:hypothetical protein
VEERPQDEQSIEQREAGDEAEPSGEGERRDERQEHADEDVLRDSDQGPGGQFE